MISDAVRRLWRRPAAPDPPRRVWRDWVLVAVCLVSITLEVTLRPDVTYRWLSAVAAVAVVLALPFRRTRVRQVVLFVFGLAIATSLLGRWSSGDPEAVGLYTMVVVLVVVYALFRWGSGRDIVFGVPVLGAAFVLGVTDGSTPRTDLIAALVFFSSPGLIGVTVREWTTSRARELEQMRSQEREQLARELHDTVAHHMSAIVIRAQAGRVVAALDPAAAVQALEGIEEEGARTLEELRAMVGTLRDADTRAELAPRGGVADLASLARLPDGGPRVSLQLSGELDNLTPAVDAAVYRIVQESLTNASRHALDATRVCVEVAAESERVLVSVVDDGAHSGRARPREGYGLTGMRERAELLGGSVEAGPTSGRGWSVVAVLPRAGGRVGTHVHPRAHR